MRVCVRRVCAYARARYTRYAAVYAQQSQSQPPSSSSAAENKKQLHAAAQGALQRGARGGGGGGGARHLGASSLSSSVHFSARRGRRERPGARLVDATSMPTMSVLSAAEPHKRGGGRNARQTGRGSADETDEVEETSEGLRSGYGKKSERSTAAVRADANSDDIDDDREEEKELHVQYLLGEVGRQRPRQEMELEEEEGERASTKKKEKEGAGTFWRNEKMQKLLRGCLDAVLDTGDVIVVRTDGASRGNPGDASIGIVIQGTAHQSHARCAE